MGLRPLIRPYDPARDAAALRALNVAHQDFSRSLEPSWPPGENVVASMPPGAPDDPATYAWVHDLFVLPEHRRRGLATALVSAAEAFVHDRGASELRLAVINRNAGARVLYERAGFRDYVRVLTRPVRPREAPGGAARSLG